MPVFVSSNKSDLFRDDHFRLLPHRKDPSSRYSIASFISGSIGNLLVDFILKISLLLRHLLLQM